MRLKWVGRRTVVWISCCIHQNQPGEQPEQAVKPTETGDNRYSLSRLSSAESGTPSPALDQKVPAAPTGSSKEELSSVPAGPASANESGISRPGQFRSDSRCSGRPPAVNSSNIVRRVDVQSSTLPRSPQDLSILSLVVPPFLVLLQCRMISAQAAPSRTEPETLFADVIVPRHLAGPFTYTVPSSLRPTLRIGHRVLVPFGRSILEGAVVALSYVLPQGLDRARLKEIRSLQSEGAAAEVSANLFQLSRQVAEAYVAPWGQCLRLVLPPMPKPRAPVFAFELTEQGRAACEARKPCSVKERAFLTRLRNKPSGLPPVISSPGSGDLLRDLKARGWVVEVQEIPPTSVAPLVRPSNRGIRAMSASPHRLFLTLQCCGRNHCSKS